MSKFVVTGASGYLASQLIMRLLADGHEVVALSRRREFEYPKIDRLKVEVADYADIAFLTQIVSGSSAVFHLAARAHQRSNGLESSLLFHEANVVPTVALAQACANASVGRLVFVSSIGVLGNCTYNLPFSDSSIPAPSEPYAISKAAAEKRLIEVLSDARCSYCILRPPLVYGPGSPGNFASLVSAVANAPLVPLAGIKSLRTFIFVDHLLDALIVAACHPAASRRTFVIADNEDISVAEIVRIAARVFRRKPWSVVEIPAPVLRALIILLGKRTRWEKMFVPLRVDSSGFRDATGWFPSLSANAAIINTLQNWPSTQTVRTIKSRRNEK